MLGTLTIPQVRQWRPGALDTAGQAAGEASTAVDTEARSLARALEDALSQAGGQWADAARDRAADEARIGARLADALDTARQALGRGATDIGRARTALLDTISAAEADGFRVADNGRVTPPSLPPVLTSPDHAAAALASRNAEQERLNERAQGIADDVSAALQVVAAADGDTARSLSDIRFPETLESAVDAYLDRAWRTRDLLGALGAAGAGAVSLAALLKKSVGLFGRSRAFLDFLKSSTAPITDYETFLRNINASDDALKAFVNGKADGGLARFLIGSRAARLAGKVFLPLTVATGALDAVTGGGYDGARGWATRGFGLVGAAGGGALLASSAGLIALGDVADGAGAAADWAGDRISDVGGALEDSGKSVLHTVSLGLL